MDFHIQDGEDYYDYIVSGQLPETGDDSTQ
jgi:hypothetical protein